MGQWLSGRALHRRTQRSPVRFRSVPLPRLRRQDERPRFMDLGIGYPSPCKRHVHPEIARMGFVRNRDQLIRIRPGRVDLFPAAYGVRSPADAPALTSQGSDFLSPFPTPGESRAHGRRSSAEEHGLQSRMSRVRIPPRPPYGPVRARFLSLSRAPRSAQLRGSTTAVSCCR